MTVLVQLLALLALAENSPLQTHCASCHSDDEAQGEFKLTSLGTRPEEGSLRRWLDALDRVKSEEMPPQDDVQITEPERTRLVLFLKEQLARYRKSEPRRIVPRRMNNREFENSVRDVLMIEDVGTHQPTDNLIGDSLHHGFDTHGETLGFSKFHLEQYIVAARKIVDAAILAGEKPEPRRYEINSKEIFAAHTSQNTTRPERHGTRDGFDFLDPRQFAYFKEFKSVPTTGRYKIIIRCTGKDRGIYDQKFTGIYDGDPIRLSVLMGNRERVFDLPDEESTEIELNEWLAAGTRLRLEYPTDGLRLRGNGNFKFQNAIAGEHIMANEPDRYTEIVADIKINGRKPNNPKAWHNWVDYWQGARPRLFGAEVEGPYYDAWPPLRQVALIGRRPNAGNAAQILEPIAERAWCRKVRDGELDAIVKLVQDRSNELGDIEALKEGIVSILVSPQFLLLNRNDLTPEERFASKFSYFLESTLPDAALRESVARGELDSFVGIRNAVERSLQQSRAGPFQRAFPFAWLELNDINFMAPDPAHYHHYHRKHVSEDMVNEALHFFRHAVDENIPIPEFLSADYSFVNADLAQVYGLDDVASDSRFRKYTFTDGRRGGLLGMGAFLTVTADSLSTSPIHRAIYVMENLLGIVPTPPPADVQISEPDVRQAKTIKEILEKHRSDTNCASCHQRIDPYGYAFENFDPAGAWRDAYTVALVDNEKAAGTPEKKRSRKDSASIPIDASAQFRDGAEYHDIIEYRRYLQTDANRDRFVRCFITKLLTYANGSEPEQSDFAEIDAILSRSAEHGYRIVDTIAAVIDSPLFCEQ